MHYFETVVTRTVPWNILELAFWHDRFPRCRPVTETFRFPSRGSLCAFSRDGPPLEPEGKSPSMRGRIELGFVGRSRGKTARKKGKKRGKNDRVSQGVFSPRLSFLTAALDHFWVRVCICDTLPPITELAVSYTTSSTIRIKDQVDGHAQGAPYRLSQSSVHRAASCSLVPRHHRSLSTHGAHRSRTELGNHARSVFYPRELCRSSIRLKSTREGERGGERGKER